MGGAGKNGYIHGAFLPPLSLGKEKEERKRRIKNGMAFFYIFLQKTFITLFLPFIVLFPDCRVLAGGGGGRRIF